MKQTLEHALRRLLSAAVLVCVQSAAFAASTDMGVVENHSISP
jgi:hypothetical protein